MPKLKFLAQTIPKIWRGSQNFKSRSRDPLPNPFDLVLHFFSLVPLLVNLMLNLKFLAQTVSEIWSGSQNFKSRSRDSLRT